MLVLVLFLYVGSKSTDCTNVYFWAQNFFSKNDRFLVELSSEHDYAHFVPKKVPVLVLFPLVAPKVQFIDCPNVQFWAQNDFSKNNIILV